MKVNMKTVCCLALFILSGCSAQRAEEQSTGEMISLYGQWITEANGTTMLDPQPSGLALWRGKLLTVSDRSAHLSQRMQLHVLNRRSASLSPNAFSIVLSQQVKDGCFADYLQDNPDLEALVVDPDDDNVMYVVTEDASDQRPLSWACQQRYSRTGSTHFPTLLVRLQVISDRQIEMTHARPLQFADSFEVGNFPNDGIEGLAIDQYRQLYLGLEKDQHGQPRIFSVSLSETFWQQEGFIKVTDAGLEIPHFSSGNHPINGMQIISLGAQANWLVAAARNDDELWFIDLDKRRPTKRIQLEFWSPTLGDDNSCPEYVKMDNASIEGVAVDEHSLWLINDPWKINYHKNIVCEADATSFKRYSPLLFSIALQDIQLLLNED